MPVYSYYVTRQSSIDCPAVIDPGRIDAALASLIFFA
jgi:hypothetical protein